MHSSISRQGNSVTVNIVYEIGLRLAEMEAGILEV